MSSLSIIITSVLNSASIDCLSPFHVVLAFGPYFFVSSIQQPPCVCFCVLGRVSLTLCLRNDACKFCGVEPYVMTRVGQSTSLLCVCMRRGLERRQCCCLVSGGLPSSHPISSHFTHFLYATGTLPAIALVVNPRVGGFVCILRPCGPFKWTLLKIWQFLLLIQPPLVFTARSYGDLSS